MDTVSGQGSVSVTAGHYVSAFHVFALGDPLRCRAGIIKVRPLDARNPAFLWIARAMEECIEMPDRSFAAFEWPQFPSRLKLSHVGMVAGRA